MSYFRCFLYFMFTGFIAFCVGRAVPKHKIDPHAFPFYSFGFEKDGKIYEALSIKSWQNHLPDMSKILPGSMPKKKLTSKISSENLSIMIRETCVSEFTHYALLVTGLGCFKYFESSEALFVYLFYAAINIAYSLIQRYNRPRLIRVLEKYESHSCKEATLPSL